MTPTLLLRLDPASVRATRFTWGTLAPLLIVLAILFAFAPAASAQVTEEPVCDGSVCPCWDIDSEAMGVIDSTTVTLSPDQNTLSITTVFKPYWRVGTRKTIRYIDVDTTVCDDGSYSSRYAGKVLSTITGQGLASTTNQYIASAPEQPTLTETNTIDVSSLPNGVNYEVVTDLLRWTAIHDFETKTFTISNRPAPTCSISVTPASVPQGSTPTVSWMTSNTNANCTASGAWSGSKAQGVQSEVLGEVDAGGTYTLSCPGAWGTAGCSTVLTVSPRPGTLSIDPVIQQTGTSAATFTVNNGPPNTCGTIMLTRKQGNAVPTDISSDNWMCTDTNGNASRNHTDPSADQMDTDIRMAWEGGRGTTNTVEHIWDHSDPIVTIETPATSNAPTDFLGTAIDPASGSGFGGGNATFEEVGTGKWWRTGRATYDQASATNHVIDKTVAPNGMSMSWENSMIPPADAHVCGRTYRWHVRIWDRSLRATTETLEFIYNPASCSGGPAPSCPVISSFTADDTSLSTGQQTTLRWASTNGEGATLVSDGGGDPGSIDDWGSVPVNGSQNTGGVAPVPNGEMIYTLTVTKVGCADAVRYRTVYIADPVSCPVIDTFTATPVSIASGASSMLAWTTTNATSVTINQGIGAQAVDGNVSTGALAATRTYTLTASKAGCANVTRPVTVTVGAPSYTVTASAGPNCAISSPGATSHAQNATPTYTFTPAAGYEVDVVSVNNVAVARANSYTFAPINANQTISVTCRPAPASCQLSAVPAALDSTNQNTIINWSGTNVANCVGIAPSGWVASGPAPGSDAEIVTRDTVYTMRCTSPANVEAICSTSVDYTESAPEDMQVSIDDVVVTSASPKVIVGATSPLFTEPFATTHKVVSAHGDLDGNTTLRYSYLYMNNGLPPSETPPTGYIFAVFDYQTEQFWLVDTSRTTPTGDYEMSIVPSEGLTSSDDRVRIYGNGFTPDGTASAGVNLLSTPPSYAIGPFAAYQGNDIAEITWFVEMQNWSENVTAYLATTDI